MSSLIITNQFTFTNSAHGEYVKDCLAASFQNGERADIVFICKNQRLLHAHRVVLAAASPFFRYLLENSDPYNEVYISVTDYEVEVVHKILAFLYNGEAVLSKDQEGDFMNMLKDLEIWGCSVVEVDGDQLNTSITSLTDVVRSTVLEDVPDLPPDLGIFGNLGENEESMDTVVTFELSETRVNAKSEAIQCKTCGQVFNTRTGLRTHMMMHKGEKPFICEVCSKSFRQASHLKTHLRVHTGEKPFKCEICNRGFSHAGSLNEHKNLHSKDKPYKCDVCHRTFAQRKALRTHHCGENPEDANLTFPCPHCPRSFANRRGLAIHRMHQHADSEPLLQCEKCTKTFSNEMSYEEHLLTQCE